MKAISSQTMRALDAATIDAGIPGLELMERAGRGAFEQLLEFCEGLNSEHCKRFLIVCGKGDNGGDGYVVARYLHEIGLQVKVVATCPIGDLQGDACSHAEMLSDEVEVVVNPDSLASFLIRDTIIVDALLGTGVEGPVREPCLSMIREINDSGLPVVAIDLPSGLNADSGEVANIAIEADMTITIALPKTGLLRDQGTAQSGMIRVVDIGIPPDLVADAESAFEAITADDIRHNIRRIPKDTHKGAMGRVMIIGGCLNYPGAPTLAGSACLRSGSGLVTVACPVSVLPILPNRPAALIMYPVPDDGHGYHGGSPENLGAIANQDVLAIGPGLGINHETQLFVNELLKLDQPVVLDADGLRVFEVFPEVLPRDKATVITPHPGEMRRLIRALDSEDLLTAHRETQAREVAARLDCVVVLKGAHTVVAAPDGRVAVNTSGTPALATGGSGDVLTGMIAAWLQQIIDPFEAAKTAVYVHGYMAEIAMDAKRGVIADDLVELINPAMAILSPHA